MTSTPLIILTGVLLLFLLLVFTISIIGKSRQDELREEEKRLQELDSQIRTKQVQLNSLQNQVLSNTVDKKTSLPHGTNQVLDIYDESNIKIPLDIIEELSYMNFHSEKEVFDYIENQRNYWTLEHRKKPYRKV